MAIPAKQSIYLPLLRAIADAGGELVMAQAISQIERFFPELTEADKRQLLPSGRAQIWPNRVQWARVHLIDSGHLDRMAPRGVWRITEQGMEYLNSHWSDWVPSYPDPEKSEALRKAWEKRLGRQTSKSSRTRESTDYERAPRTPTPRLHELLKDYLHQIGVILEHYPQKEHRQGPYIYDVVWREFADAPRASHVFEVQDKGNLIEALAKLQHARDIWGSKLFLVVTGEKDRQKLTRLVAPLLEGTFHRLSRNLVILSQEETEALFGSLSEHKELLRHLLT